MCKINLVPLAALLVITAGCAKKAPPDVKVEALPAIQSASGGEMVLIPEGTFTMGDSGGRPDEAPPHEVAVSSFYLDKNAVTQDLYLKVMGINPSKQKDPRLPVERTQWTDAVRFCNKCSEQEGLTPCYNLDTWECNFAADGYRLPTEAEWEYACRAGSKGKYSFGDDDRQLPEHAWLKPHSLGKTQPVGQKLPNRWGLFDMHGNVWQWCNDWYDEAAYTSKAEKDPHGPKDGKKRVLRGGAWDSTAEQCRASYRHKEFPVYSDACFGTDSNGFRRARNKNGVHQVAVNLKPTTTTTTESGAKVVANIEKPTPTPPVTPSVPGKLDPARLKGTIVFVSDRSKTMKIWSMHASGKGAKQLTKSDGPDADPRFSPDGKQILYTTLRGGFPEIWLMNRDGSDPKFVTKGSQGNWAPNGKTIIFILDNQTYIRDLAAGKERLVTPKSWERCGVPAFSPDGERFAVASRHKENIGIFIFSLDGKEIGPLKAEEPCCTPQWSKDGKRIICQTVQGHIHEVGVDGKKQEQLTFGADVQHDARYSPDGTMILFCRAPTPAGPWQICVQKRDGDEDDFATLTTEGSNLLPDWHADE